MGLEKLLKGLYGTVPQIDLDQQIARSRVVQPLTFDFRALAEGIRKNNVGVAGITFQANVAVKDGVVAIQGTGQSFPLRGAPPAAAGPAWRTLQVLEWDDPSKTVLQVVE